MTKITTTKYLEKLENKNINFVPNWMSPLDTHSPIKLAFNYQDKENNDYSHISSFAQSSSVHLIDFDFYILSFELTLDEKLEPFFIQKLKKANTYITIDKGLIPNKDKDLNINTIFDNYEIILNDRRKFIVNIYVPLNF